jgi:hypothetical protein
MKNRKALHQLNLSSLFHEKGMQLHFDLKKIIITINPLKFWSIILELDF